MNEEALINEIETLYFNLERSKKALLEQYKASSQKYPIGFTFPYKGETAKITGYFVYLIEPDINQYDYAVYTGYTCYVPSICDAEIQTQSGKVIIGEQKDNGVNIIEKMGLKSRPSRTALY